jgi:hypothetical protein
MAANVGAEDQLNVVISLLLVLEPKWSSGNAAPNGLD